MPRPGANGETPPAVRRLPRRHADPACGRRRVSQALDPARHLRRDPRPGRPEDQRRVRLRRRAKLQIQTVEQFLGIDIDHVVIVDFEGFKDFIDAIGGVKVDLPTSSARRSPAGRGGRAGSRSTSARARSTLNGNEALIFARTRPTPARKRRLGRVQQLRRHRPRRGPAGDPVRDQGPADQPAAAALQLHQGADHRLDGAEGVRQRHGGADDAPAGARGDDRRRQRDPDRCSSPRGPGPAGSLIVPVEERQQAVEKLLGERRRRARPTCSPRPEALLGRRSSRCSSFEAVFVLSPESLRSSRTAGIGLRPESASSSSRAADFEPLRPSPSSPSSDFAVVGRVEARALEVHRDRVEDALDRRPALLAPRHGVLGHALEDLELVPVAAAVLVDRHRRRDYRSRLRPSPEMRMVTAAQAERTER